MNILKGSDLQRKGKYTKEELAKQVHLMDKQDEMAAMFLEMLDTLYEINEIVHEEDYTKAAKLRRIDTCLNNSL
jgi:stalled ribosome rescue protein Dom34